MAALQSSDRVSPDSISGPFQMSAGDEVPVVCFQFRMSHFTCKAYLAHGTQDEGGSQHLKLQTVFDDNRRSLGEEQRYFVANEWNATKRYTRLKCGAGGSGRSSSFTLEYDVLCPSEMPHSWGLLLLSQTLRMWYTSMVACVMHIVEPREMPFATHDMIMANTLAMTVREEDSGLQREACPICFEAFRVGEKVRRLPCMHLFHVVGEETESDQGRHCNIDRHLTRDKQCPVCKTPIDIMERYDKNPAKGGEPSTGACGSGALEAAGTDSAAAASAAPEGEAPAAAPSTAAPRSSAAGEEPAPGEAAGLPTTAAVAALATAAQAMAAAAAAADRAASIASSSGAIAAGAAPGPARTDQEDAGEEPAESGAAAGGARAPQAEAPEQAQQQPPSAQPQQRLDPRAVSAAAAVGLPAQAVELERAVRSLQSRWLQIQDVVAGMQQMLQYIEESQSALSVARQAAGGEGGTGAADTASAAAATAEAAAAAASAAASAVATAAAAGEPAEAAGQPSVAAVPEGAERAEAPAAEAVPEEALSEDSQPPPPEPRAGGAAAAQPALDVGEPILPAAEAEAQAQGPPSSAEGPQAAAAGRGGDSQQTAEEATTPIGSASAAMDAPAEGPAPTQAPLAAVGRQAAAPAASAAAVMDAPAEGPAPTQTPAAVGQQALASTATAAAVRFSRAPPPRSASPPPRPQRERWVPFTESEKICMAYMWRQRRSAMLASALSSAGVAAQERQ